MKKLIFKIKSAYKAFMNPLLIEESESLKRNVYQLLIRDEFALVKGQYIDDYLTYELHMIPGQDQNKIRDIIGAIWKAKNHTQPHNKGQ